MTAGFPQARPRRLRRTPPLRRLVAQTDVRPADLVQPLFVKEGISEPQPVSSMPGRAPAHQGEPAQGGGRRGGRRGRAA